MSARSSKPATQSSLPLPWLTLLGGASALWAVFLWRQLVESRAGGTPFCAFGGSDCAALWDGAFASWIQGTTSLPVAGWGLLWGLLATAFPALAVFAKGDRQTTLVGAYRWVAIAGLAGVAGLLAVSAQEGGFCSSCSLTYVFTFLYAVLALRGGGLGALSQRLAPALGTAVVGLVVGWLLLLIPGRNTPVNLERAGLQAVADASSADDTGSDSGSASSATASRPASTKTLPEAETFLASLDPQLQQGIANSIGILGKSPTPELEEPEHYTLGSATSPVRFSDWTDVLCGHCANLHATFEYFVDTLPENHFALVSRHFPLDGNCNRHLEVRGPESVRCLAARAQICMEPTGNGFTYSGALFRSQGNLDRETVFVLAAPFMDRAELEQCVASPETNARLAADVEEAWKFEPHGTPLVLINGRQGTHFGPFLYALALTSGQTDHPALALLPEADAAVVDSWGDHSGHNH